MEKTLPNFSHALCYKFWAKLLAETPEGVPAHFPRNVSAGLSTNLVTLCHGRECTFPRRHIFWPMKSCESKACFFISPASLQKLFTA